MSIKAISHSRNASNVHRINTPIQKRHTSNTKTYGYIKKFLENNKDADQLLKITKESNVHLYPKTVTKTLYYERTLQLEGYVTVIHATQAIFTPAIHLATQCELKNKQKNILQQKQITINTFAVIRDPSSLDDHYTQMMHILQVLNDPTKLKPDRSRAMNERVLSVSFGLLNLVEGESAAYFGLRKNQSAKENKYPGFAKNKTATMIENTLKNCGYNDREIKEISNSKELQELLDGFNSLNTGNFLVYGIPREIAQKSLYDSHAFGIPTGNDVLKVFDGIEGRDRITSHQARLVLSKEIMRPDSGIIVLSSLDEDNAVDSYFMKNKHKAFIPPFAYKEFEKILPLASTEIENDEISKRKTLLEKSRIFAYSVAKGMSTE